MLKNDTLLIFLIPLVKKLYKLIYYYYDYYYYWFRGKEAGFRDGPAGRGRTKTRLTSKTAWISSRKPKYWMVKTWWHVTNARRSVRSSSGFQSSAFPNILCFIWNDSAVYAPSWPLTSTSPYRVWTWQSTARKQQVGIWTVDMGTTIWVESRNIQDQCWGDTTSHTPSIWTPAGVMYTTIVESTPSRRPTYPVPMRTFSSTSKPWKRSISQRTTASSCREGVRRREFFPHLLKQ